VASVGSYANHVQLAPDNHASTSSVFLQAGCSLFLMPYNSVKELKTNEKCGSMVHIPCIDKLQVFWRWWFECTFSAFVLNMHVVYMLWMLNIVGVCRADEAARDGCPFEAGTIHHSPPSYHRPAAGGWHRQRFWSTSDVTRGWLSVVALSLMFHWLFFWRLDCGSWDTIGFSVNTDVLF